MISLKAGYSLQINAIHTQAKFYFLYFENSFFSNFFLICIYNLKGQSVCCNNHLHLLRKKKYFMKLFKARLLNQYLYMVIINYQHEFVFASFFITYFINLYVDCFQYL